ncbi:unnamed protein product [Ilex paraguariensis]|uniref:Uncharacterized protein n=1 Tax=Ilex paraguariensis TaxID=185542 RepID=A0ABC8SWK9_9AQUA
MGAANRGAPRTQLEGRVYREESAKDEAQIREVEASWVDVEGDTPWAPRAMLDDEHRQQSPQLGSTNARYGQVCASVVSRGTGRCQALGGGSGHGARKSGSRLMEQSTPKDASIFGGANSRQTMDDMVHSGRNSIESDPSRVS